MQILLEVENIRIIFPLIMSIMTYVIIAERKRNVLTVEKYSTDFYL